MGKYKVIRGVPIFQFKYGETDDDFYFMVEHNGKFLHLVASKEREYNVILAEGREYEFEIDEYDSRNVVSIKECYSEINEQVDVLHAMFSISKDLNFDGITDEDITREIAGRMLFGITVLQEFKSRNGLLVYERINGKLWLGSEGFKIFDNEMDSCQFELGDGGFIKCIADKNMMGDSNVEFNGQEMTFEGIHTPDGYYLYKCK